MNNLSLLRLLHLCDPALPIGSFAHSAGLETYVQRGIVRDKQSVNEFIVQQLSYNVMYNDAAFASLAYDATPEKNLCTLFQYDEQCNAAKIPSEIRKAGSLLGKRLLKSFAGLYSDELTNRFWEAAMKNETPAQFPVVFGMLACVSGIPKSEALTGFFYNAAAAMVTNAVKLVPLGQREGQEILFSLLDLIHTLANDALHTDSAMIGLSCAGFDVRCMQHERLYSRLYMS